MKRPLLLLAAFFIVNMTMAQVCVPDVVEEEPFGIWPAPEDGFAIGNVGELYTQVVSFKIPEDSGEIPGGIPDQTIDSIQVTQILNLPDGLLWACESHSGANCTFYPNIPGCAVITGIPTESGLFELTIQTNAYVELFGTNPVPFPFDGFEIEIQGPVSVAELAQYGMMLNQNAPNPFEDNTVVSFSLNQSAQVDFNIYNLLGKIVHTRTVNAAAGENRIELNADQLNMGSGIYLYSLAIDGQSVTRKMVVK